MMQENNRLNFLREELYRMLNCDEINLYEGEILEKSQQLDEAITIYYNCLNLQFEA